MTSIGKAGILLLMAISLFQLNASQSSIGGYGELHYNINRTDKTKTLDFHRFIIFYYHSWNDQWSFVSEVELEHNFVKSGQGELELEQAYVDYHPTEWFGFRAGVVLPSIGIINETHEPPTFLSVERPNYARDIIPTTWFGNGVAVYGGFGDFDYKLTVMEGLNGDGFNAKSGIRGGRLKGYKSNGDNLLTNLRLDYLGLAGAKVGFSYSQNNAFRENADAIGLNLFEVHAQYNAGNLYSTVEYGMIQYDAGDLKQSKGYYAELGYNIASLLDLSTEIIPWFRWTDYNPAARVRGEGLQSSATHVQKWLAGLTVKPIPQVVFKLDFGEQTIELGDVKTRLMNLGVGYMF